MTSFKIINDDIAVRGLQKSNKTPVISGPVMPVKPSSPVQKSPGNLSLQSVSADRIKNDTYSSQRRQLDRRKKDNAVLLDTRSSHDRRTKNDRNEKSEKDNVVTTLRGIDEII